MSRDDGDSRIEQRLDGDAITIARLRSDPSLKVNQLSPRGRHEPHDDDSESVWVRGGGDIARFREGDTSQTLRAIIETGSETYGIASLHKITHSIGFIWKRDDAGVPYRENVPNQGSKLAEVLVELRGRNAKPRVVGVLVERETFEFGGGSENTDAHFQVTEHMLDIKVENLDQRSAATVIAQSELEFVDGRPVFKEPATSEALVGHEDLWVLDNDAVEKALEVTSRIRTHSHKDS